MTNSPLSECHMAEGEEGRRERGGKSCKGPQNFCPSVVRVTWALIPLARGARPAIPDIREGKGDKEALNSDPICRTIS